MNINVFAKFVEFPSLPVQDIKDKIKMLWTKNYKRAITLIELAPSPYFSVINLVHINVFAKFDHCLFKLCRKKQNVTD